MTLSLIGISPWKKNVQPFSMSWGIITQVIFKTMTKTKRLPNAAMKLIAFLSVN